MAPQMISSITSHPFATTSLLQLSNHNICGEELIFPATFRMLFQKLKCTTTFWCLNVEQRSNGSNGSFMDVFPRWMKADRERGHFMALLLVFDEKRWGNKREAAGSKVNPIIMSKHTHIQKMSENYGRCHCLCSASRILPPTHGESAWCCSSTILT